MSHADDLVKRYIMIKFREENLDDHLSECPDTMVSKACGWDGDYGCESGCPYLRLEATIACPHQEPLEFEYGQFGEMNYLFEDLDNLEGHQEMPVISVPSWDPDAVLSAEALAKVQRLSSTTTDRGPQVPLTLTEIIEGLDRYVGALRVLVHAQEDVAGD